MRTSTSPRSAAGRPARPAHRHQLVLPARSRRRAAHHPRGDLLSVEQHVERDPGRSGPAGRAARRGRRRPVGGRRRPRSDHRGRRERPVPGDGAALAGRRPLGHLPGASRRRPATPPAAASCTSTPTPTSMTTSRAIATRTRARSPASWRTAWRSGWSRSASARSTPTSRTQARRFGVEIVGMDEFDPKQVPIPSGPIYVTIDLDGLDPAFAPGVAHPEGGGLSDARRAARPPPHRGPGGRRRRRRAPALRRRGRPHRCGRRQAGQGAGRAHDPATKMNACQIPDRGPVSVRPGRLFTGSNGGRILGPGPRSSFTQEPCRAR